MHPNSLFLVRWLKMVAACWFIHILLIGQAQSQTSTYYFRHLTNNEGLSEGMVHAFEQDQYGFIWIGTKYGLNRFDGISIQTWFSKPGDSSSLINNLIQSLYCDSKNNLWVGTYKGLCRYDFAHDRFIQYAMPRPLVINDVQEDKSGLIWVATEDGLWNVDEQNFSLQKCSLYSQEDFKSKFQCSIRQFAVSSDGTFYMASTLGIKIFNPLTQSFGEIRFDPNQPFSLSGDFVNSVALDSNGFLWAACVNPVSILNKIDLAQQRVRYYDHFITGDKTWRTNSLQKVLVGHHGRVWITAQQSGISLYDDKTDSFYDYVSDPFIPNSILSNFNISIFQSRDDIIWLGTAGYGISYFNPQSNFFTAVYPFLKSGGSMTDNWCRAACDDRQGNHWLGTGQGVAVYDHHWNLLSSFRNDDDHPPALYVNSVRSLLLDDEGDIWIGTARGLNRYRAASGTMDFFDDHHGIPLSFFWMMALDKNGGVWLGSVSGLYRYKRDENKFDDLHTDSILSPYAHRNIQALYNDSHNRLWIGILDVGLLMYDIDNGKTRLLTISDSLISDTRFSSFAEDQDGILWIGSEEGLVEYDPVKNQSRFYTRENGLPSNRTNNIMVDSFNRIWIGTSNGLCVLNESRDHIKRFDVNDGLITNQFNEQSACLTSDGLFVYPTYKGFQVFRPEQYQENNEEVPLYITSFKINDKEIEGQAEELEHLELRPNENIFSLEMTGLNFMNPYQCRYAYRMDPLDQDWNYTTRREINFTKLPAGEYTFRYKAITDHRGWNVREKAIRIFIRETFYKTWWFRSILLVLLGAGFIFFFRYRLQHRESLLVLESKAQLLEKEKTLVMYENLKQHLNPHFLFNSLTSLSSLITQNQKAAGHFLDNMSKVYRYILKNRENETVPLSEELKFVDFFIQLQKARFEDGLIFNINIEDEHLDKKVAPVTLQNLVENAIKHNVADTESPLMIDLFVENNYLVVRNTLQKKKFVETSHQQGLSSMKSLYHYLTNRPMEIEETENYFTVKIPLI